MNRRQARLRTASIGMMFLVTALSVACGGGGGGGGGGGTIPGGRTATFAPDNLNPGANTVSMAAGASSGDTFWVDIEVTGITDFFGAGFRVSFDSATAQFTGNIATTGSFIEGQGTTDFDAAIVAAGVLDVNATLQGQVQGVTPAGTDLLISLEFQATADTAANDFAFAMPRGVSTCPAPPAACTDLPDAGLTWSGGTMNAN